MFIVSRILNIPRRIKRIIRGRQFPVIPKSDRQPSRPISFVVVRFSKEIDHNIMISPCVHNHLNQLIIVDNTSNIHYNSLSKAINSGLEQAKNDIVVIVHEDVFLPKNWQSKFEEVLEKLEKIDSKWGVLGTAGLTFDNLSIGHYSDPTNYCNIFPNGGPFEKVKTVDEHLMVFRKSTGLKMDELHPGIHGIGTDLVINAQENGMNCYVIDAPSVHKYQDANGKKIKWAYQSTKIVDRANYAYLADKECCDDYVSHKWAKLTPFDSIVTHYKVWRDPNDELKKIPRKILENHLDNPIILLGKGGGGSRLLSFMVEDCDVCLGNELNISGDCIDMTIPIYKAVIEKYSCKAEWQKNIIVSELRLAAAKMLMEMPEEKRKLWGFKLPENLLLLPELNSAFPNAKFVQMIRNPVSTCLRRTHMTARLDNQVGRVTLPLAYREAGLDVKQILEEPPEIHNARTTLHQLNMVKKFGSKNFNNKNYIEIKFENLIKKTEEVLNKFSNWLGVTPLGNKLVSSVDKKRASNPGTIFPAEIEAEVKEILSELI